MRYQAALRPDCSTNTADKRKFKGYIVYKFIINLLFNAIRDLMIIECPNCNKKFSIDKKLIPKNGRTLKCSSCDHIWHYKISINKSIDDSGISQDKNTNLDTNISEVEKKEDENNDEINEENLTDINQGSLSEKNTDDEEDEKDNIDDEEDNEDKEDDIEDEEDEEDDIKNEKGNDEKKGITKMILVYFIVVIISLLGLIFLLDTFKSYLISVFPTLTPIFDSFYETLLDFKLFIKDLTN